MVVGGFAINFTLTGIGAKNAKIHFHNHIATNSENIQKSWKDELKVRSSSIALMSKSTPSINIFAYLVWLTESLGKQWNTSFVSISK